MSRDDQGAATLLVTAFLGLLLMVGAATGAVTGAFVAHRRAEAAADLAALAAARAGGAGGETCVEGARVAAANGATLRRCVVDGAEVEVEVVVPGPRWLGRHAELVGRARAGPA